MLHEIRHAEQSQKLVKDLDLNMNGVNKAIGICDLTIGDTQWKMVLLLSILLLEIMLQVI